MSQLSKVNHSRNQWKDKAKQRGDANRYLRKQLARLKAERDQAKQALKETQARLRQLESQAQAVALRPKVDVVWLALRLFLEVRISFRAVCRVLSLLAADLGIHKACDTQKWVPQFFLNDFLPAQSLTGGRGVCFFLWNSGQLGEGGLGGLNSDEPSKAC